MRKITFIGSTSSNYLFGKGRGRDKKKRKRRIINALKGAGLGLAGGVGGLTLAKAKMSRKELIPITAGLGAATLVGAGLGNLAFKENKRNALTDAKDFVVGGKNFIKEANIKSPKDLIDIYQKRKDSSSVATNSTAALGAALGASQAAKLGMSPATGALIGAFNLSTIGSAADREISKEKARYRKEGARSRLGKIGNDARIGAKSTAGFLALDEAFRTGKRQLMKTNGLPLKRRIIRTVGAGLGGALLGAAKGSAIGAGIGSGVGTIRGFTQKNKKKDKS